MNHLVILRFHNTSSSKRVSLFVLVNEIEAQPYDDDDEQGVATQVSGESDKVPGTVPCKKHLRSCRVEGSVPRKRVHPGSLGGVRGMDIPIAFPVDHMIKFRATTTLFLVCPATFRDSMERARVCADQKDNVI